MKEFVKKIMIYLISVAALALLINYIYITKPKHGTEEIKFQNVPNKIKICNFGSSHGVHGYYYEDLEDRYTCFNFALDSQSLSYDQRVLEYYQDNIDKGAVVIIDISYFACWGLPETEQNAFESKNRRYYRFLPPSLIKEYDLYTHIMVGKLPALSDGPVSVAYTILKPRQEIEIKSYPDVFATVNIMDIAADTKASCQRHIFQEKRDENAMLIYNDEEVQALYDMVELCRVHEATPVFVTVPYLKEYTDTIGKADPDFYHIFYSWIESVSDELDVEYFGYSLDGRFINDYQLFYNGDHMNSNGAKKFTNILFDEVIKDRLK